jgi:hypothetical protein
MSTKQRILISFIITILMIGVLPAHAQDAVSDLLGRINGLRASLGLPGYTLNGSLSAAALNQAQWMAITGQISHTQPDGSTPSSRAAAAGYSGRWVSENIYAGSSAGIGDAWNFWLNSPIHYRGMTNPNYQEIGIASASSSWGRAYVLVFGSPGGSEAYIPPSSAGGGSAASGPPPYVVGLDGNGNIMHEVQPDQTIGDILLIYGYTWSDMPYFLTLNTKTQADIRSLQIGEIVLIPPQAGTYTPTAPPANWPTNTPEPQDFLATAIAEAAVEATQTAEASPIAATDTVPLPTVTVALIMTELPTITPPSPSETAIRRIATSADVPIVLNTVTLLPTLALNVSETPTPEFTQVASLNTPIPLIDVIAPAPPTQIPWIWIAVGVQIGVALMAGVQFFRRKR